MTEASPYASLRVHVTGVSDVHNFGDALFPVIAAHRLAPYGITVVAASPTGAALSWPDALPSVPVEAVLLGRARTDGLVIGGGHIIVSDAKDGLLPGYGEVHGAAALPALWLGASVAAALHDVPVAWNAPGVFGPLIGSDLKAAADAAIRLAGYVSVRDAESLAHLGDRHGRDVAVVPDTVFGIAALWPRAALEHEFEALAARKGVRPVGRILALHMRGVGPATDEAAGIAARIDALADEHDVLPLFVAVGPGAGDAESARMVARRLRVAHILLDDPRSLREIAAALAMADLYVGQSLHGYIVAADYGVPGLLIGKAPSRRFRGVLTQLGRPGDLVRSWDAALDETEARLRLGIARQPAPATATATDRHWSRVAAALLERRAAPVEDRLALLRAHARLGLRRGGAPWLLQPFASRQPPFGDRIEGGGPGRTHDAARTHDS